MGEARYRLPGAGENEASRKANRSPEKKKLEPFLRGARDKILSCRSVTLKLTILSLLVATSFTFLFSPVSYHDLRRSFKSSFTESTRSKERYNAQLLIKRSQVFSLLATLCVDNKLERLQMGLVNFNNHDEIREWEELVGQKHSILFPFEHVHEDVQWADLYPEWIDEEEEFEIPKCPNFPMPIVKRGTNLDLVVVKVPCHDSWSRDIVRLQVELAGAHVASSTEATHVLLLDSCRPLPNLFTCGELVAKASNAWLFKVNLPKLRKKLSLPVGSCELAVPLESKHRQSWRSDSREAYATILHSAQLYVCGAITVAQSIRLSGSTRDLVILVDKNILPEHRKGLEAAGWRVIEIERIRNPKAEPEAYNEWNYSKFRLWQLTIYEKIIFIDADLLILRNIDFLFELPEISATGNNATLFNSGVMVIEPSNCTFELLMDRINDIVSYNGGDQGYLNEIFTWWHRIPRRMNFLKYFWSNDTEEYNEKTRLFGAETPELYVLHYLGLKPWVCFRDFDCNWNVENQRSYASDVAHALWWKVHDSMPQGLQQFCLLRTKQKAQLEWDRMGAQNASFPDEHWRRNITDPRLNICNQDFCFWESMLWHWGDPAYDDKNYTSSPTPSSMSTTGEQQLPP